MRSLRLVVLLTFFASAFDAQCQPVPHVTQSTQIPNPTTPALTQLVPITPIVYSDPEPKPSADRDYIKEVTNVSEGLELKVTKQVTPEKPAIILVHLAILHNAAGSHLFNTSYQVSQISCRSCIGQNW